MREKKWFFKAWILPLVFLAGYLMAWGTILVDRQMIIASQGALAGELKEAKRQLRLREMMQDFGLTWEQLVIWNKENKLPPEEEIKWNLPPKK